MITPDITIYPIPTLKDNYVWTIINKQEKRALIVDPGEAIPVINYLQQHQIVLMGILITHHHWDHVNGLGELKKWHDVPVFGPSQKHISGVFVYVDDNDIVKVNDFCFSCEVIAIPGHTLDHVGYYSKGMIFCGDTLFGAGCGRLFEGTAAQLYASLQKIAKLDDETKIYCAHEYTLNNLYFAKAVEPDNENITKRIKRVSRLREKNLPTLPSTLGEEKETNPFLRCHVATVMNHAMQHIGHALHHPIEVFSALRQWKDQWY